jgi:hypothetical protein
MIITRVAAAESESTERHPRPRPPSSSAARLAIAGAAAREVIRARLGEADQVPAWKSLGPVTGESRDASGVYAIAESGLVDAIRVDPRDPNVVFVATAGGGVWRTADISAATPTWQPLGDQLADMAVGGFDLDPQSPDTIVVGLGEPFYQAGGFVQISHDAGATWGAPVALGGATNVRDVRIDPTNSNVMLVAADAGLFRSIDAGAHFIRVDLPNVSGLALAEATWSIVYTGHDVTGSHWAVSGVDACDVGLAPPQARAGVPPGSGCKHGNPGEIWRSRDGGATWTTVPLPATSAVPGRMTLAAGSPADPTHTAVYVMVGNRDETNSETMNIFRSLDGGATYASALGMLTNPDGYCTMDIGSITTNFNQAIAVDPANADRVMVAGLACSVRTLNGTAASPAWQVVSDVFSGATSTACGHIPYVHSDFHAALIANGRVLLGQDGGLATSTNALSVARGEECSTTWATANVGLVTHLCWGIASGDVVGGDPEVVFAGMQDISTRWRSAANPENWDTINLSDGTGGEVVHGAEITYWEAQAGSPNDSSTPDRQYCKPADSDCGRRESWNASNPALTSGDSEPFVTMMAAADAEPGIVISHSSQHVWKADATPAWTDIGDLSPDFIDNVATSSGVPGVYAAALFDHAAVTSDGGAHWTLSSPFGIGSQQLWQAQASVALPPQIAPGTQPGDVYLAASPERDPGRRHAGPREHRPPVHHARPRDDMAAARQRRAPERPRVGCQVRSDRRDRPPDLRCHRDRRVREHRRGRDVGAARHWITDGALHRVGDRARRQPPPDRNLGTRRVGTRSRRRKVRRWGR